MIRYKLDVLAELKRKGYNTTRIRRERIFGEATLTRIRRGLPPDGDTLGKLCELLRVQPGKLLEWLPDPVEEGNEDPAE